MNVKELLERPLLGPEFPLPLDAPFTRAMARAEKVDPRVLARLCDAGLLRRPIQGVYLTAQAGDSIRLRAACLALAMPADSVICDRHAGWLHGAEMVLAPNDHLRLPKVSVFRPSGHGRLRNELSVSGERNLTSADITEVWGLPVTTPLRTALDLGRLLRRDQGLAALDAMLRLEKFLHDELLGAVERFRGMRGVRQLRVLAPIADGRAESPGESVLRLRWLDLGLPRPEPQISVYVDGIEVARLDLGLEEVKYAAEYDGEEWHSSDEQRRHDRKRRGWLDRENGWTISPVRKHSIFGQHQDIEQVLWAGLRTARERHGRRIIT
jgi:hypothetical protein